MCFCGVIHNVLTLQENKIKSRAIHQEAGLLVNQITALNQTGNRETLPFIWSHACGHLTDVRSAIRFWIADLSFKTEERKNPPPKKQESCRPENQNKKLQDTTTLCRAGKLQCGEYSLKGQYIITSDPFLVTVILLESKTTTKKPPLVHL